VDFYIPHRFGEGYGLNDNAVAEIIDKRYALLVTLDCGISDFKQIKELKEKSNIEVIVTDHHTIPDKLPNADVIINPKFLDNTHPLVNLCGVGVVYKFLEFFISYFELDYNLEADLDLVALGTIADVVSLRGENRGLAKFGLKRMGYKKRFGIERLLSVLRFNKEFISVRDVGFVIAPRINAAGRLEHASIGVDLLTSKTEAEAEKIARYLDRINLKRQRIGQLILKEAQIFIEREYNLEDNQVLVLAENNWHAGVIGITAAQLVRKYSKPTVMISITGETGRGSARSLGNVDIYSLLKKCSGYFLEFGGHKQAAGFSILAKDIEAFSNEFRILCNKNIKKEQLQPIIDIDVEVSPDQINLALAREMGSLAPFGQDNAMPALYTNKLVPIDFKTVGDGSHLKATFSDKKGLFLFEAIGFGLAHKLELLYKQKVEVVFNVQVNNWGGQNNVQLNLLDLK
jgi:single-stranded-DNA-specific exonuclease